MSKYQINQINQINQIDQDLDFVFDVVCSSSCKSFACVFGALVQTCTLTQENAATACYCMLLHATAECSVSVSVSHCEATQAESKVFYQKMKARMSVDCVD